MRYSFRLAKLVGHTPDPRKRPGTIKQICEFTGLDRHQVAALLKNEVKYIPMEAIGKLCDYLLARGLATPHELPGVLFSLEPENFWELLARRHWLEICLGVRRDEPSDTLDDAWVVASDSVLFGKLLNGVTALRTTGPREGAGADEFSPLEAAPPVAPVAAIAPSIEESGDLPDPVISHPELISQSLVWSPSSNVLGDYVGMAKNVKGEFWNRKGDKALVSIGSSKSNPVSELVISEVFGCEPFQTQDDVSAPGKRRCPIFLRYRDQDPSYLVSCCGGHRLAVDHEAKHAGIYYELPNGKWEICPWDPVKYDAAFVFYVHRESQGVLEMVLGGYSGRATRLLAQNLDRHAEKFWPPVFEGHGLEIGAFIVKFELDEKKESRDQNLLAANDSPRVEVIRLDPEVIDRRLTPLADRGE